MNEDLTHLSLTDVAEAIRTKQVSAVEVTAACLSRIERLQPKLNCFISIEAEAALKAAAVADADLARGVLRGPLHGVPLAYKDMFYRAGQVSTCGSKINRDFVPDHTATVLSRLEAAGGIYLGGLNMAEFALGPTGHNEHWGHCRNPWNPDYITGGSSSGSGSAVAARITYGALGSDTGGSVRMPAGVCGVVGLKPTWGRVSRYGVMPLSFSLDTVGPLARTVQDCARLTRIIAGSDPMDSTCSTALVPDYEATLLEGMKGLKVGVPTNYYYDEVTPEVRQVLDSSLEVYKTLGAEIYPITVPDHNAINELMPVIMAAEAATFHGNWIRSRPQDYSAQVRSRIEPGLFIPATRYLEALHLRSQITQQFVLQIFSQVDVLHTPLLSFPVPTVAETDVSDQMPHLILSIIRCTRPINYLGLPALTIPCGFSANGLPVAFQLIGRPLSEAKLLTVGSAFEAATQWHKLVPNL